MNQIYKNLSIWILISLIMLVMFQFFREPQKGRARISYSEFLNMVESGSVLEVTIKGEFVSGSSVNGPFKTYVPQDPELIKLLRERGAVSYTHLTLPTICSV